MSVEITCNKCNLFGFRLLHIRKISSIHIAGSEGLNGGSCASRISSMHVANSASSFEVNLPPSWSKSLYRHSVLENGNGCHIFNYSKKRGQKHGD